MIDLDGVSDFLENALNSIQRQSRCLLLILPNFVSNQSKTSMLSQILPPPKSLSQLEILSDTFAVSKTSIVAITMQILPK